MKGLQFGVFGLGHPDWVSTFHAVPKLIDERLEACGGCRLVDRGKGNAAEAELFEQFDDWEALVFNKVASDRKPVSGTAVEVQIDSDSRKNILRHEFLQSARVVSNDVISRGDAEIKRHIVVELPEGSSYRAGDYIGILPMTPGPVVQRALARYGLHYDDLLTLSGSGGSYALPFNTPVGAYDLLAGFLELESPVTSKQVERLANLSQNEDDQETLRHYLKPDVFPEVISAKRVSLLDLLEEFPSVNFPLNEFLTSLPAIRMRQVSFSCSFGLRIQAEAWSYSIQSRRRRWMRRTELR